MCLIFILYLSNFYFINPVIIQVSINLKQKLKNVTFKAIQINNCDVYTVQGKIECKLK